MSGNSAGVCVYFGAVGTGSPVVAAARHRKTDRRFQRSESQVSVDGAVGFFFFFGTFSVRFCSVSAGAAAALTFPPVKTATDPPRNHCRVSPSPPL